MAYISNDKYLFHMLYILLDDTDTKIFKSNNDYIIAYSYKFNETWIWTNDNIENKKEQELIQIIEEKLINTNSKITCKKKLYDKLNEHYKTTNYLELNCLICTKLNNIELNNTKISKIDYSNKIGTAKLWQENYEEETRKVLDLNTALEDVETLFINNFYISKNIKGEVVSMAGFTKKENISKITHVYTKKSERRKGYSKNLVYFLTKILLERGETCILYTNKNYLPANALYKSIGYKEIGTLISFNIENNNI